MAPEVKIRNLDEATLRRLKDRADQEGRSMESMLRAIISDAVGSDGITASDWENAGFEEVDEIVPGRLYEVVAGARRFRIAITRAVLDKAPRWNSSIDELEDVDDTGGTQRRRLSVWSSPVGIADRHLGDTAEQALGDAIHWLSVYAGVDAVSRARRSVKDEGQHHPGLHLVVGSLRNQLGADAAISWQDRDVARVSIGNLYFVLSRIVDTIVMEPYVASSCAAVGKQSFLMSTDVASIIAASMRLLLESERDRSAALSRSPKT